MQNEIKLLCNHCFQPLTVHKYDIGTFVDRCGCEERRTYERGYEEGYDEGREYGKELGYDWGLDDGREEAARVYESKIEKLEDEIESFKESNGFDSDDEYGERIGI